MKRKKRNKGWIVRNAWSKRWNSLEHEARPTELRMVDIFAASAMQGLAASPQAFDVVDLTERSYEIARAMMKVRVDHKNKFIVKAKKK